MVKVADIEKIEKKILTLLQHRPMKKSEIHKSLSKDFANDKSLQRFLRLMIEKGILSSEGNTSDKAYRNPNMQGFPTLLHDEHMPIPDQPNFESYRRYLNDYFSRSTKERKIIGYEYARLDEYIPNKSHLLSTSSMALLSKLPKLDLSNALGATYNAEVSSAFLKQFAYNSSRLEGVNETFAATLDIMANPDRYPNDEKKIIILNHGKAVDHFIKMISYPEFGFEESLSKSAGPIRELHMVLMDGLLKNDSEGEIRTTPVQISLSTYQPSYQATLLEKYLNEIVIKSSLIQEDYEKAFFLMLHISYLQAFYDGNKRTARLMLNLPLIKSSRAPHVFHQMSEDDYHTAIVFYYETNDSRPLEALWIESYISGIPLFDLAHSDYKIANLAKAELSALRLKAVRNIVLKKKTRNQVSKIAQDIFSSDELSEKYPFELFESQVVAACEKLAMTGLGGSIFELKEADVSAWTKIWKTKQIP